VLRRREGHVLAGVGRKPQAMLGAGLVAPAVTGARGAGHLAADRRLGPQ
jgi:hypothetical protein